MRKGIQITLLVLGGIPVLLFVILLVVGMFLYHTADFLQPDVLPERLEIIGG